MPDGFDRFGTIAPPSDGVHALFRNMRRYGAFPFFAVILPRVSAALFRAPIRRGGVFEAVAPVPDRAVAG